MRRLIAIKRPRRRGIVGSVRIVEPDQCRPRVMRHGETINMEFSTKMSRQIRNIARAAALMGAVAAGSINPAAAAPLLPASAAMTSAIDTEATPVRWRGGGTGVAAGLATGLIIGGLLAAPHYYDGPYAPYGGGYYPPPPYAGPAGYGPGGWEAYCFSRYRSFDPVSGTYVGYDGRRRYCR
jgi:hypothetical protein